MSVVMELSPMGLRAGVCACVTTCDAHNLKSSLQLRRAGSFDFVPLDAN